MKDCSVDHHPEQHEGYARVRTALFVCLALAAIQGIGSWISGSLALLADTVHVLSDGSALLISLLAGWLAIRPASASRSYGFYRIEILAALVNGIALIAIAAGILWEAYHRLNNPQTIQTSTMIVVATLGLILNLVMLKILHPSREDNINIRGAYLHVLGDALSSVVVIVSAFLIYFTDALWIDAAASAFVAIMILTMAVRLVSRSTHVLLEGAPLHLDAKEVQADLKKNFPEIKNIHDFHIWEITTHLFALTAHLESEPLSPETQNITLEKLQGFVRDKYQISHSTFQLEFHALKSRPNP